MKVMILWFFSMFLLGCNAFSNYRTEMQPIRVKKQPITEELKALETNSMKAPNDSALAKAYLEFAILSARENCLTYIGQLKISQAHRNYVRGTTSQIGGLTSAIMGLSSVSPAVIGGTGAFFGFADTNIDSYNNNYMPSPDISDILEIATKQQNKKLETIRQETNYTYPKARLAVNAYESICTNEGITLEIKKAIRAYQ